MKKPLLELKNLKTHFTLQKKSIWNKETLKVHAVDGVNLKIEKGQVLGLVGESGCGKSTLGRSLMRLVQPTSGQVFYDGQEVTSLSMKEFAQYRPKMQMIFQDPYASLDPRMTVYDALAEPLFVHKIVPKTELVAEVSRLMDVVGLAPRFMQKYPHEFSGGQRQRIAIARALALRPELIVADEPVSALDVSIQSQILNLIQDLKRELDLTLVFISHDLSVVKYLCDDIAVMYQGKIVEYAEANELFHNPQHIYTKSLISAIPIPDPKVERTRNRIDLPGEPQSPINPGTGCPFAKRVGSKTCSACRDGLPELKAMNANDDHLIRTCHVEELIG